MSPANVVLSSLSRPSSHPHGDDGERDKMRHDVESNMMDVLFSFANGMSRIHSTNCFPQICVSVLFLNSLICFIMLFSISLGCTHSFYYFTFFLFLLSL